MTIGNFQNALLDFRKCLQNCCLSVAETKENAEKIYFLIKSCTEYITSIRCQLLKPNISENIIEKQRILELSFYMCICNLKIIHRILILKNTIGICYKFNNFYSAAELCKRLLDFKNDLSVEIIAQYEKYYTKFKEKNTDEIKISEFGINKIGQILEAQNYVDVFELHKLKNMGDFIKCPFDYSTSEKENIGKLCKTCELCKIGDETIGLKLFDNI